VFSVKFPELSLFQISELLHFIEFRKKFIKYKSVLFEFLGQNLQVLYCDFEWKVFDLWSRLKFGNECFILYLKLYACVVAER
jgi:hypothetical protein